MSVFEDAFTDATGTLLTAHTPVLLAGGAGSGTWSFATVGSSWVVSNANRARNNNVGNSYAFASLQPSSASYDVEADYLVESVDAGTLWYGLLSHTDGPPHLFRMQARLTSNGTTYDFEVRYYSPTNNDILIGSTVPAGITAAANQAGHIRFSVRYPGSGNLWTLSAYLSRSSDGFYLKPDGSWQSGLIAAVSATYDDSAAVGFGSQYAVQAIGYAGIGANGLTGDTAGVHFDNFKVSGAGSLALNPTAVGSGSTGSVALTGGNVTWTPGTPGSPTFTATSGTINGQQVLTATTATLNYTAPGSPTTATIADPTGGSALLTIQAGLTPGTLAPVAGGSTSIQLTSTTPSAGTAPYTRQLYRSSTPGVSPPGTGTLIGTQTSSSTVTWTDSTAAAGQVYWYAEYVTDSAGTPSHATTNETYATLWQPTIVLGLAGDSITANEYQYDRIADLLRSARGPRLVTLVNKGQSGSAASGWTSGSANMNAALAAFATASCTHVAVMLGTNGESSVGAYTTAITNVVSTLTGAGYIVWLFPSPFSANDSICANVIQYRGVLAGLDNGTTVRFIDDTAFTVAAGSYASGQTVLFSDNPGIHYTSAGGNLAGDAMYRALDAVLFPAAGGVPAGVRRVGLNGGF